MRSTVAFGNNQVLNPSLVENAFHTSAREAGIHLIAENFQGWIGAIHECVDQFRTRLPRSTNLDALATFVLVVMEGGVMLSRSYGSVEPFDNAVKQLRQHFNTLLSPATRPARAKRRTKEKGAA